MNIVIQFYNNQRNQLNSIQFERITEGIESKMREYIEFLENKREDILENTYYELSLKIGEQIQSASQYDFTYNDIVLLNEILDIFKAKESYYKMEIYGNVVLKINECHDELFKRFSHFKEIYEDKKKSFSL